VSKESQRIDTRAAPRPLGAYAHAARAGQLLFISGQGARDPATGRERGVLLNPDGSMKSYDIREQTRAAIANVEAVLRAAGGALKDVVDVTVFLLDMTDFAAYNEVYAEAFGSHRPARTTVGAASLPGNNAIEIKAVACLRPEGEPR
jgi:reactive intermediate/imine deaminase